MKFHKPKASKKKVLMFLSSLAIFAIIGGIILRLTASVEAAWFDDTYLYRKPITFTNTGSAVVMQKVKFDIDTATFITANKMQSDCDDIRFTDATGTQFPFYYDSAGGACNTSSTDYYVLLTNINVGTNTVYMYYGNATASSGTVAANFSNTTFTPNSGPTVGTEAQGTGPVSYWSFDDLSGSTANDYNSSQNNDLTITNALWKNNDMCNQAGCLYFDGNTDYATKSYSADTELLPGTGSFTITAWAKHSSTAGADTLISRVDGVNGVGWKLYMNSSGFICFGIDAAAGSFPNDSACTTTSYADSQWHYITGVKSGTTNITIFIDGAQITQTAGITATTLDGTNAPFTVGNDFDNGTNGWDGFIDQVKYYNFAKTATQVKTEYASKSQSKSADSTIGGTGTLQSLSSGLVGYWKLEDTSDSSGNTITLTNNGTTTFSTGKFGNASTHNGTTQYLSTATSMTGVQTIAFWVNPANTSNNYINLVSGVYINSTTGTISATGITSPSIYVNGVLNGTITASAWNHVVVTTQTAITANAFEIGRANGSFLTNTSKMDDVRLYNRILTGGEVQSLYTWSPGPIGWFKLDDVVGTTTPDSSGNGNNGTMTNGPVLATGKIGQGVKFDGTNDYISVTDNANIDFTGDFTISMWVNSTQTAVVSTFPSFLMKETIGSNTGYEMSLHASTDARWYGSILVAGTEYRAEGSSDIADGKWHFVTFQRSGSNILTYQDGVYIKTVAAVSTDISNAINLAMGANSDSPNAQFMNGSLDDIRMYNYARTPKQILEDMNGGHPAVGTPVGSYVGYWNFDELNGTTANDKSINSNNLTLSAASWTTNGKLNAAWNGTGSVWLTRADDDDFDFAAADDFSIAFWFKSDAAANPAVAEYAVEKGTITNTGTAGYAIYANTSGNIVFGVKDDAAWGASSPSTPAPDDTATSTTDIYDTKWHHIVATKTGTSRIDLYVDGNLNASDTSIAATATLANAIAFRVGDDDADSTNAFNGDIDELKIYRAALNATDVQLEYNLGSAMVLGSYSTAATPSPGMASAYSRTYCVPGDTATCTPPVGEWHLDDNAGTSAVDKSGNNVTGTVTGNPVWGIGKIGPALKMDGVGDYVTMATNTFATVTTWTLNSWIFPTSLADFKTILWKAGNVSLGSNYDFQIMANGSILCEFEKTPAPSSGFQTCQTSTTPVTTNKWHFVSCTYDGTTMKIYYNGILQATTGSCAFASTPITDTTRVLNIGRDPVTGVANDWPGTLDEVQIFGYARTAGQIAWDYNRNLPAIWSKLDECQGTTANDSSGNGLNGTITIGASGTQTSAGDCTTSSTAWGNGASGKFNSALKFDGTDDYITYGNPTTAQQTSAITLSAWVYYTSTPGAVWTKLFGKWNETGNQRSYTLANSAATGSFMFYVDSAGNGVTSCTPSSSIAPTTNTWYHVVGTYDGSNCVLYVNGQQITSTAYNSGIFNGTGNLVAGGSGGEAFGGGTNYMTGLMDDLRLYPYALTATQVKTLYNDGAVKFGPITGTP